MLFGTMSKTGEWLLKVRNKRDETGFDKTKMLSNSPLAVSIEAFVPGSDGGLYMMMIVAGHGKGYRYDLRGEADLSVGLGIFGMALYTAFGVFMVWKRIPPDKMKNSVTACFLFGLAFFCAVVQRGIQNFFKFFTG